MKQPHMRRSSIHSLSLSDKCALSFIGGLIILAWLTSMSWHDRAIHITVVHVKSLLSLAIVGILMMALWRRRSHASWRYWCACLTLMSTNIVGTIGAQLGWNDESRITEAIIPMWAIFVVYMAIYSLNILALAFLVPIWRFPKHRVLRLTLDTVLVISGADLLLQMAAPFLTTAWVWTPETRAVELRLAATMCIGFWYVSVYRQFSRLKGRVLWLWSIGLGCAVLHDLLLLLAGAQILAGTSRQVLDVLLPFEVMHVLAWALGLYWFIPTQQHWFLLPVSDKQLDKKTLWIGPLRSMMVVILITVVLIARVGNWASVGWFLLLLGSQEALNAYDLRRARRDLLLTAQDLETANHQLATQAADLAIANTNLAAANIQLRHYAEQAEELATDRERLRLARDIHDTLGHHLVALNMQLEQVQEAWTVQPSSAFATLGQAKHVAETGLAEIRRSIGTLRTKPDAERQPLLMQLTSLAAQAANTTLTVEVTTTGTPRLLPVSTESAIYRIAQEALTNMHKHAQAQHATIQLDYCQPHAVRLTISDDGEGSAEPSGGYGLLGMQERVALLQGRCEITTSPGTGFTITVEVPT